MKFCADRSNASGLVLWPQLTRVARSVDERTRDGGSTAPEDVQGTCRVGSIVHLVEGHPLPGRGAHDHFGARGAAAPGRLRTADNPDGVLLEACDAAAGSRAFLDAARNRRGLHGSTHGLLCNPAFPVSLSLCGLPQRGSAAPRPPTPAQRVREPSKAFPPLTC